MTTRRRKSSEIELTMAVYFDVSAEASEMCKHLLKNIKSTQSNYRSMDSFLAWQTVRPTLVPASLQSNPFCTMTRSNFRQAHDRSSCILRSIRSCHRRVARKLRMVKAVKKLWRACVVMVCGVATAAAICAAAHLLFFGLLIAARGDSGGATKRSSRTMTKSLLRLREQLDTAAKGTYVLGRDLVARLSDGIERENDMARRCVERSGQRCPVQEMVSELRRSMLQLEACRGAGGARVPQPCHHTKGSTFGDPRDLQSAMNRNLELAIACLMKINMCSHTLQRIKTLKGMILLCKQEQ
ncbi:LOW QUALITY PROTEIN: hypothetical protein U9M48_032541 [Paspalum notatum var. saurae]|uniref:Uncharacterized protein n=1 Tax=Paspalum notatum var. saurae TaxID=547442 RepID=A0AAQ3X5I4_PASNO